MGNYRYRTSLNMILTPYLFLVRKVKKRVKTGSINSNTILTVENN